MTANMAPAAIAMYQQEICPIQIYLHQKNLSGSFALSEQLSCEAGWSMDAVGTVVRIPAFRAQPLVASSRNAIVSTLFCPQRQAQDAKLARGIYIYVQNAHHGVQWQLRLIQDILIQHEPSWILYVLFYWALMRIDCTRQQCHQPRYAYWVRP